MSGQSVVIAGFPSSNRVPGAFGEVLPGTGGQSAASLPIKNLVVGLASAAGTITPDSQVVPILSLSDADNFAGPGSEGACMLYDALKLAGSAGVPLFYAAPKAAGGATAATTNIRFNGTATAAGAVVVRVNGQTISQSIASGDTAATVATNLAAAISGFASNRSPLSATASTVYCVIASRTLGQRGMQHVVFLDVTQMPAGITGTLYVSWAAGSVVRVVKDQIVPLATPDGFYFVCTTAGTGAATTEPTWVATIGSTTTDGTAVWTCWGTTCTGGLPTTAVTLGNATGLETYTNLLGTIGPQEYGRIGLAANDATSLAAWKTQIDSVAAAPQNSLQHVCVATNGTLAAATSLAQVTLNDPRFQLLWEQNAETHPSRIAAAMAAVRALGEQQNPNASYDGMALVTVAPQTQQADWPSLAVLISALNNSVTPVSSYRGDGYSRVERSITTKSLTSGSPDYSTIDTGMMSVPDFVLKDGKLQFGLIRRNNPVCQDDPPIGQKPPPSGVLTPSKVTAIFNRRLENFSLGILSGTSPSVTPICLAPVPGDVQCTFDPVARRPMVAENVNVMPIFHQLGISVRQAS